MDGLTPADITAYRYWRMPTQDSQCDRIFVDVTAFRTREMARIAKKSALASAFAVIAFAGPAFAAQARYMCSGGGKLKADFSPPGAPNGKVKLTFGTGRELTLPQVLSADGGRYADAHIEFWIKGRSATLTMKGVKETCATPWLRGRLKTLFLSEGYDRRLSLEFNDPKLKHGAQALLPPHKPTGARLMGSDRSPDRIPIVQVRRLALYRVVNVFCRHTHCRQMIEMSWRRI
jgi:membrane-bound inhibitor of C-type lysozyme